MRTLTLDSQELFVKTLPRSEIVFPESFLDRLKYLFWRLYTPMHPYVRDILLAARVIQHTGRQEHLLGTLAPEEMIESITRYLVSQGYGNHFVAWRDKGEMVGLRRVENFEYQYHIRIFEDGEVRGHYEYTPECHPILHMCRAGREPRREAFLQLLGERIISTHM